MEVKSFWFFLFGYNFRLVFNDLLIIFLFCVVFNVFRILLWKVIKWLNLFFVVLLFGIVIVFGIFVS